MENKDNQELRTAFWLLGPLIFYELCTEAAGLACSLFGTQDAMAVTGGGALLALPLGCGKKQDSDDPAEPVNLTVWVYYNGDQLESFNQLVAEFNDTTGREKGIIVDS